MRSSPSTLRRAAALAGAVAVAAAWFTWLRPTALGGDASYVIVEGGSMEPTYEDGDLVLVQERSEYEHGDVIAFRAGGTFDDPTRIIHRIVGDAPDGGFHTQGDNRDRVDPWEPGSDDIIGRAVLHVPKAGQAAGLLTSPATLAAVGGAAVVVGGRRHRRRRRVARPPEPRHAQPVVSRTEQLPTPVRGGAPSRIGRLTRPRWAFVGLITSALLAFPVVALAWSALRAPDSTQRTETVGHLDYGIDVDYRFTGTPSPVYPSGEVTTTRTAAGAVVPNDPLYSRLLDRVDVELQFSAREQGASLSTTYAVDVTVETPGGWSTTIQSIDPTVLEGAATAIVPIDLRAIAMQVAAVAELTGVGGEAYTINVTPALDLAGGTDAGGEVRKQISAPMTFAVENNLIAATAIDASEREELTRTVAERATYAIGPVEPGTQAARGLMGGMALVLVAGIAWFASVLFGGLGLGEPDRISARYRSQIVDVATATAPPGPVVMVSAIDELARISKVEQTVIVHEDLGDGAHRYRVFLGTVTYEYESAPEHAGAATEPVDAGTDETGS
ncbi:MAG: signal peptidase I [Acidimicrobiales bacterium]